MARLKAANNAITKLTVGITAADTSFTVEDAALFPDAPFRVTIDAEIMQVEAIDKLTNTFSAVQRGIEGTVAAPHNNGAEVANRWTAGYLETLATLEESQAMATMAESEAKTHAEAYADDVAATAETSAKTHATGLVGTLSSLLTTAKDNIVAAINEIFAGLGALETDVAAHKAETTQAHDLSTLLAAKVDKAVSATSGNIAVFDGGAQKIGDGGAKVTDFFPLNRVRGSATYTDNITSQAELTKSIALGGTYNRGFAYITSGTDGGGIVCFDTNSNNTKAFSVKASGSVPYLKIRFKSEVNDLIYGDSLKYNSYIEVRQVYIANAGKSLRIVFRNSNTNYDKNLNHTIRWEVW